MKSNYYVYMYLRTKESNNGAMGSPYYIGKGKGDRFKHLTGDAIKPLNDNSNVRFLCENLSEDDAFMWEVFWIAEFGRIDLGTGCLRNRTDGGEGTSGISNTLRKKKQEFMFGPNNPMYNKDSIDKLKKSLTGRKLTQETKDKIRKTLQGNIVTEEARQNLSKALKGKIKKKSPCMHCSKLVDAGNMKQHHGDRCKYRTN